MALGAIRMVPITILAQAVVTISVLAFAAPYGLEAVALSTFTIIPFCSLLSLVVVRHFSNSAGLHSPPRPHGVLW